MNRTQFEKEVNDRIRTLMSYMAEVQKIKNYRFNNECSNFIPATNSKIREMRNSSAQVLNMSDADFYAYDFTAYFKHLDDMMKSAESTLRYLKSLPPIRSRVKDDKTNNVNSTHTTPKLSKIAQKQLKENDFQAEEMER